MKFIKLGAAYINMDLVTDIWVDHDRVNVFLAVPVMYTQVPFQGVTNASTTRELQFTDAEARALIAWLEEQAEAKDITPPHYQEQDRHATQPAVQRPVPTTEVQSDDQADSSIPF
jgi:hypothetical protein